MRSIITAQESERERCPINVRHPEERRRRDLGTQFYMCEAHNSLSRDFDVKINEKILKNLLNCSGSPRPPAGGLGMTGTGRGRWV